MSRGKDLIKNTGILMIAKISTQFVGFMLLPLYTALLSTSEYGEVDIYTSMTMIVIPFLTLQLEMGLFRFFITESSEDSRSKIITTSFSIISIILCIASVLYWLCAALFNLKYSGYIFAFYISQTISAVLLQVCRAYGNNKAYGIASFISSALAICLNVLFIAGFHWKVEGILLSSTIAQLISIIYIVLVTHVFQYFDIHSFDGATGKKLLNYSVPLVFNQISSWAINYSDRVIILSAWGTSANGVYSLANKFSNITNTFFNVFNVAWTENVVRCMEDKDSSKYISEMFALIYNIYLALVTGIINLLPFVFNLLVNENYNEAYGQVPVLLLAIFFSGMAATIGSVYIAYNKTKEVSITTILASVCSIVMHLGLLKSCYLYAASISTLVSFALLFIYRYIYIKKFFELKVTFSKMLPQMAIYGFAWIAYIWKEPVAIISGLVLNLIYIGIVFMRNKDMLLGMLKQN